MDLALAGGVDISLCPFELIGFAKAAPWRRRDHESQREAPSFLAGEGCGFVVLMSLEAAGERGL